jgi:hypothetical protein
LVLQNQITEGALIAALEEMDEKQKTSVKVLSCALQAAPRFYDSYYVLPSSRLCAKDGKVGMMMTMIMMMT